MRDPTRQSTAPEKCRSKDAAVAKTCISAKVRYSFLFNAIVSTERVVQNFGGMSEILVTHFLCST